MNKALIIMICHTLKGAGLSCLFTMLQDENQEAIGVKRLAAITGYDRKTVSEGMVKLETLGMVQWQKRYDGWTLTQLALNEILPINTNGRGNNYPSEGEILHLPQRSSSSLYIESDNSINTLKPLLHTDEGEILPLAELLVKQGCPRRTAKPAIETALNRGALTTSPCFSPPRLKTMNPYQKGRKSQNIKAHAAATSLPKKNTRTRWKRPPKN
jgi:hypothetical protein